jgi:ABC-type phosphate transport system substrate-binding protein
LFLLLMGGVFLAGAKHKSARTAEIPPEKPSYSEENLAIVVNLSNPVRNLTKVQLRKIFLGEVNYWPNGHRVTLVMRHPGDPERKTVLREVCQMSEEEYKNHFLHGLFTGDILWTPKILETSSGVRKFVFNVPGAIGYLRPADVDATVKVVPIDELLPDDKGYKLRITPGSPK